MGMQLERKACEALLLQVGLGWSGVIGTGLVVGQKDGAWTSPSAISLAGLGWGFQAGGTVSDILVVLRNRYFSSVLQICLASGNSASLLMLRSFGL